MMKLTHLDEAGNARMVDVGEKTVTHREAVAEGTIRMSRACLDAILEDRIAKGNVLCTAEIAAIMAAKRTGDVIPLCHTLVLNAVKIDFSIDDGTPSVKAVCTVSCDGKTGAEMEALHGVSVALLTIYDMCKAVDKRMVIENVHLTEKTGGKSGQFRFEE